MQSTSSNFDIAVKAIKRKPKARITITWADPFVDSGLTITPNEENNISDIDQIADNKYENTHNWFMLDGYSLLNGSFELFPKPPQTIYQVGWYGSSICNGSGNFSPVYPSIDIEFSERPVYGIFVSGEPELNQYPVDFTVKIYLGISLLDTITVSGNNTVEYFGLPSINITAADKITLTITKWSKILTNVKILEFYTTIIREYIGDTVKSINIIEEREIRDGTTPIGNISSNEAIISLQNIEVDGVKDPFFPGNPNSDLKNLLKPGRKIKIEIGFVLEDNSIEYVNCGTFWSGDFNISEESPIISFTARDRMELLRKLMYDDNEYDTLSNFFTAFLNLTLSIQKKMPELEKDIDGGLVLLDIPKVFFNKISYFDALKLLASACGGQVYMSKNDELIIESSGLNITGIPDLFITKSEYFTKNQPSNYEDVMNKIEIETQPRIIADNVSIVYTTDDTISIGAGETLDTIEIKYTDFPIVEVTDLTVTFTDYGSLSLTIEDSEYYPWGCLLTIKNNAVSGGTFNFYIEGKKLELIGTRIISSINDNSIRENGEKIYRLPVNYLLQDINTSKDIVDDLITYYSNPRNDIIINWRGNPAIENGDLFVIPQYQRDSTIVYGLFKVYKIETIFDGTLKQNLYGRYIETYIYGI